MKILIFNWRDIKNPEGGGAEIVTHEMAKRWVESGHEVTLFTASFKGGLSEEEFGGVKIIRRGGQKSVHLRAFFHYQRYLKGKYDIVIDEINTIPFFTPLYVKEKKISYFNQLAQEVWLYEFPKPFSYLGYLLEPFYLKLYRKIPSMVISDSTKQSLRQWGFKDVSVFPMAVNFAEASRYQTEKENFFTLVYVGRVVPSKRVDDILNALYLVVQKFPETKLWIVGEGKKSYLNKLKKLIEKLRLEKNVKLWGFVSQKEKFELMGRAHVLLATSIREGWGLIVTEAAALKTPSVVYDVPGLRDAVKKGETGLIAKGNNPFDLAQNIINLKNNPKLYKHFQEEGYTFAKSLTWEGSAIKALEIIKKAYED